MEGYLSRGQIGTQEEFLRESLRRNLCPDWTSGFVFSCRPGLKSTCIEARLKLRISLCIEAWLENRRSLYLKARLV